MNPQLRAWQDRVNKRCDALAETIPPQKSASIEYDFTNGPEPLVRFGGNDVAPDVATIGGCSLKGAPEFPQGNVGSSNLPRSTIRQPGEPSPEPPRAQPGSHQITEAAAVARMASALRHLPADYLSLDWRRNIAYIDAGLTDAEIEAPGHDKAALRSEYIRRNGMIALDSCAVAAGRGARDALRCVPFAACPYDEPALASEWRRGYRNTVMIVGDRPLARGAQVVAAE